jgi:hypothetical protein
MLGRASNNPSKGIFMTKTLKRDTKPAGFAGHRETSADGSAQGPMLRQSVFGSHGYDIHPQKFVRLVGCHQSSAEKYEVARPLHQTAA